MHGSSILLIAIFIFTMSLLSFNYYYRVIKKGSPVANNKEGLATFIGSSALILGASSTYDSMLVANTNFIAYTVGIMGVIMLVYSAKQFVKSA